MYMFLPTTILSYLCLIFLSFLEYNFVNRLSRLHNLCCNNYPKFAKTKLCSFTILTFTCFGIFFVINHVISAHSSETLS